MSLLFFQVTLRLRCNAAVGQVTRRICEERTRDVHADARFENGYSSEYQIRGRGHSEWYCMTTKARLPFPAKRGPFLLIVQGCDSKP